MLSNTGNSCRSCSAACHRCPCTGAGLTTDARCEQCRAHPVVPQPCHGWLVPGLLWSQSLAQREGKTNCAPFCPSRLWEMCSPRPSPASSFASRAGYARRWLSKGWDSRMGMETAMNREGLAGAAECPQILCHPGGSNTALSALICLGCVPQAGHVTEGGCHHPGVSEPAHSKGL